MGKRYNFLRRKKALIHKANCTTEFCTGTRKLYPNICTLNKSIFIFSILRIELQINIFSTLFLCMYVLTSNILASMYKKVQSQQFWIVTMLVNLPLPPLLNLVWLLKIPFVSHIKKIGDENVCSELLSVYRVQ